MAVADRIVVMNQGRIEDFGPPAEIYMRPRSLFSAGFMGEANFIPGAVKVADSMSASVETPLGNIVLARRNFTAGPPKEKQRVTLCIRPEHFRRESEANETVTTLGEAVAVGSAFFGTHYRCHLTSAGMADIAIVAHMPQSAGIAKGQSIALAVDAADVIALPAQGGGG